MPEPVHGQLVYSEQLGRLIRSASAEELGTPTDVLLLDAVTGGRTKEAEELLDYLVEEAGRVFTVLVTWLTAELDYGQERVADWQQRVSGVESTLGVAAPQTPLAQTTARELDAVRGALDSGDADAFDRDLSALRHAQWRVHDDLTDWLWALLTVMQDALGEEAMGEALRVTVRSWFDARYEALPTLSPRESFELVIEGARGHFSGPDHSGNIEVEEDHEKWVMSFDPCGSGGRMRRGDPQMGQTSRSEEPFNFGFAAKAHDWTWQQENVCLYCAHCSFANEILSIERQGSPMRVTQYPRDVGDKCTWTIFKDPEDVPDEAYERVGKQPPAPRS